MKINYCKAPIFNLAAIIQISIFLSLYSENTIAEPAALDPSFNPSDVGLSYGEYKSGSIYSMIEQPDGKIVIGGSFFDQSGTRNNSIARMESDGTPDTSFVCDVNDMILAVAQQADSNILVGGSFDRVNYHITKEYLARILPNGTVDTSFHPSSAIVSWVRAIAIQADNKILVGGDFGSLGKNSIVRLNTDGSLDSTFRYDINTNTNGNVHAITVQPDGKILIGGHFTLYDSVFTPNIARLNQDGTLDSSFKVGFGTDWYIYSIALDSDDKVLVGGSFTHYDSTDQYGIVRLHKDGSRDTSFSPPTDEYTQIYSIALLPDSSIMVSGIITFIDSTTTVSIAKLNVDGTFDSSFESSAYGGVRALVLQSDGNILIGGGLKSYEGIGKNKIARIDQDGNLLNTLHFGSGANNNIYKVVVQPDDKLIIGGIFDLYNGVARNRIARLNSDGTLDTTFIPETGLDIHTYSIALQDDGKVLTGIRFSDPSFNPERNGIIRLNTNGSLDTTLNENFSKYTSVRSIVQQDDGKIIIGGQLYPNNDTIAVYLLRLNPDGSIDSSFNIGTGPDFMVISILIQEDNRILIGGSFDSYNGVQRGGLARLNPDGSLDNSFAPDTGVDFYVSSIVQQSDSKILIGGAFSSYDGVPRDDIARVNSDGSLDTTFNPGDGFTCSSISPHVDDIVLLNDGRIIICGIFDTYDGVYRRNIARINSDGSLDESFDTWTATDDRIHTAALQQDGRLIIAGDFTSYKRIGRNRIARIDGSGISRIEESTFFGIKPVAVYPNPTNNKISISLGSDIGNVEVLDVRGKSYPVFKEIVDDKVTIDFQGPKGLYFLIISNNDNEPSVIKFIKE